MPELRIFAPQALPEEAPKNELWAPEARLCQSLAQSVSFVPTVFSSICPRVVKSSALSVTVHLAACVKTLCLSSEKALANRFCFFNHRIFPQHICFLTFLSSQSDHLCRTGPHRGYFAVPFLAPRLQTQRRRSQPAGSSGSGRSPDCRLLAPPLEPAGTSSWAA